MPSAAKRPTVNSSTSRAENFVVRLSIDYEFASRTWWENGGEELWDALREGFDAGGMMLEAHFAQSWLEQARAIEGWAEGSEHAPHPICISSVEDDDPEL